jgi:hypothetical protein
MSGGDSYEEFVTSKLVRRCRLEEGQLKPTVKLLRKRGHMLFDFEQNFMSSLSRIR